jgi:hypothetical protein
MLIKHQRAKCLIVSIDKGHEYEVWLKASKHLKAFYLEYLAHVAFDTDKLNVSLYIPAIGSAALTLCSFLACAELANPWGLKRCAVEYLASRTATAQSIN